MDIDARPHVLVVSSARLHRDALVNCLASLEDIVLVSAIDPASFAGLFVDVAVVDTPSLSDAAFIPALGDLEGNPRIVAVAVSDAEIGTRWLQSGLVGLVPADASREEVVEAVRKAARGEFACSPRVAAMLLGRLAALSQFAVRPGSSAKLTVRERDILGLLELGLSNKEIARKLTIEATTVKNHVHSILGKLNARRRSEIPLLMRSLDPSATRVPSVALDLPPGAVHSADRCQ